MHFLNTAPAGGSSGRTDPPTVQKSPNAKSRRTQGIATVSKDRMQPADAVRAIIETEEEQVQAICDKTLFIGQFCAVQRPCLQLRVRRRNGYRDGLEKPRVFQDIRREVAELMEAKLDELESEGHNDDGDPFFDPDTGEIVAPGSAASSPRHCHEDSPRAYSPVRGEDGNDYEFATSDESESEANSEGSGGGKCAE